MPSFDLATLVQTLIDYIITIGQDVNDLPGGLAFTLGLVTWFVVEQILRRILSWIRWLVLVGAVVGLGFTIPYIFSEFFSRAGVPDINGIELSPETLIPEDEALLTDA